MEAKLKEYRALRRRKELIDNAKEKLVESKQKITKLLVPKFLSEMRKEKEEEEVLLMEQEEIPQKVDAPRRPPMNQRPPTNHVPVEPESPSEVGSETSEAEVEEEHPESWNYCITKWTIYFVIWLTFFAIALKLQFGAVYFVVSALIGIYLNTRTRPRKKGEVSAYSVFNENCVSIDGTLKAEQFEREIRYGPGSVR